MLQCRLSGQCRLSPQPRQGWWGSEGRSWGATHGYKRKETRCKNYGAVDHNVRRCQNTPVLNRRQQRAQDRELSIESSSNSSGSLDLLDEELEALEDQEEQGRQNQESESDSELASNEFKKIEGIKRLEGSSNTQKDVDSLRVHNPDDGEGMEGVEGLGKAQDDTTSNSQVQGLVFSPRKTRSGRILQ
jgi:hypothetical protein